MEIISVNIGQPRGLRTSSCSHKTRIFKMLVDYPIYTGVEGLGHDSICDTKNNGGPDQAVFLYELKDYIWCEEILQHEISPGAFGEILTIDGLESSQFKV